MLLVSLLGIYWLIWGIMELVYMFMDHRQWGWKLFMGLVSIAAGSAILAYPIAAALQLPRVFVWVLGFWALFQGIILLFMAFRGGGWGAGILGVIAIGLGILLMGDATQLGSGIAMIWASAIWALIGGVVLIVHAFQARKRLRASPPSDDRPKVMINASSNNSIRPESRPSLRNCHRDHHGGSCR